MLSGQDKSPEPSISAPPARLMAPCAHQRTWRRAGDRFFPSRFQGLTSTRELQPNGLHPIPSIIVIHVASIILIALIGGADGVSQLNLEDSEWVFKARGVTRPG